ncbi:MAG: signal peptidase II [Actinomycetota bacterium]|nr:signal peptidase II [Actinomycetota bacterium]
MTRVREVIFGATLIGVLVADQVTKALVRANLPVGSSVPFLGKFMSLTHVRNTGAAFGLFPGRLPVFIAISVLVLAGIAWVWWRLKPRSTWVVIALGLVAGGATGNLIDRVITGRVTDFFDLGWFAVFNVADIALDVGVAVLLVWLLFAGDEFESAAEPVLSDEDAEATI